MTTAHELKEELKASLIDGAPHRATGWEWAQAVDRVVEAAVAEARGPAVTDEDATAEVRAALTECIGRMPPDEAVAEFVDELSRRKVYLITQSRYDELVKRGRELTDLAHRASEALIWCSGSDDFQLEGKARVGWVRLCVPLIDELRLTASPASRAEGRKGSE